MNNKDNDICFSQKLIDNAINKRYYSTGNSLVPGSIKERFNANTPLNDTEAEFFAAIGTKDGCKILDKIWQMTEQVMDANHDKYSMTVIFNVIRWETDILTDINIDDGSGMSWQLNDHWSPYFSRWINEELEFPLYTCRGVKNEKLVHKQPVDWTLKVM